MKQARLLGSLLVAIVVFSGNSILAQQNEARATIERLAEQWSEAYNRGDIAAVAELYTEDAQFFVSTGQVLEGRTAIQSVLQGILDAGATEQSLEPTEAEILGDTAYTISSYTFRSADGQVVQEGHSILIWKQVDGEWKVYRQINNRKMPPARSDG